MQSRIRDDDHRQEKCNIGDETHLKPDFKPQKRKERIKVVFVCGAGMESSPLGRRTFLKMLEDRGLEGQFELDFTGIQKREDFKETVKKADFVVPMLSSITAGVEDMLDELGCNAKVLDLGFQKIRDQYDKEKYHRLLKTITEQKGLNE